MRYLLIAAVLVAPSARADGVDDAVHAEMAKRQIHGLSIAIVDHGKIVRATGYGTIEQGGAAITPDTLFQAGSISKSVSALAALHFVDKGKLGLDDDVDAKLVGWHLPKSILTDIRKITLRHILSHTAGLTVHGFPGYAVGDRVPTLEQVLDGVKPANTPPIRVDVMPGMMWRYSGGGYTIMQKLLTDVVGAPFPKLMQDAVLGPAGMTHSTYAQPLPADKAKLTATGYYDPHTKVPGRWHVYPEMAAAGLWTTPSDLVQFGLELGKAYAGKSSIISGATAKRMMSIERDGDGLGVFIEGEGRALHVGHNGRDEGFDAFFVFYPETGQGVAIMINANDNSRATGRIVDAVKVAYDWPDKPAPHPAPVAVDRATLEKLAGSYEFTNNDVMHVDVVDGKLTRFSDGMPDAELVSLAPDRFQDGPVEMRFVTVDGKVTGLECDPERQDAFIASHRATTSRACQSRGPRCSVHDEGRGRHQGTRCEPQGCTRARGVHEACARRFRRWISAAREAARTHLRRWLAARNRTAWRQGLARRGLQAGSRTRLHRRLRDRRQCGHGLRHIRRLGDHMPTSS